MLCALAIQGTATTVTVGLFVTAFVTAFVTVSSNTVVKSYSLIAFTFIQNTKKNKKQKKKWGSGLDQNKEGLMAFKSLSIQDLSQDSTSEVHNVILDPGIIKDGEDKGKQSEN